MSVNLADQSRDFLQKPDIHDQWLSDYLNPDIDRYYDLAFADIISRTGASKATILLDAGCGFCHHTVRLAKSGAPITAVDFSEAALTEAKATINLAGISDQVQIKLADLTALPFPERSFDIVVCWGVLMHIPDMEGALAEFARVLKPGGRLVLAENNKNSLDVRFMERGVDAVKKATGRYRDRRDFTPRGEEVWKAATNSEGLLIRKTDMNFLESLLSQMGLRMTHRSAGQLTESYTNVPTRTLKRVVYAINRFYFSRGMNPERAMGNILYFEKAA